MSFLGLNLGKEKHRRLVLFADISVISFVFFLALAILTAIRSDFLAQLNQSAALLTKHFESQNLDGIMEVFSNISSPAVISFLFLVIAAAFARREKWQRFFETVLAVAGGAAGYYSVKIALAVPRPDYALIQTSGYSFPSGHSAMAVIFFSLAIYFLSGKIKNIFGRYLFVIFNLAFILAISLSRLYLGVHRLSEILAGWTFGIFWFSFSMIITTIIFHGKTERY